MADLPDPTDRKPQQENDPPEVAAVKIAGRNNTRNTWLSVAATVVVGVLTVAVPLAMQSDTKAEQDPSETAEATTTAPATDGETTAPAPDAAATTSGEDLQTAVAVQASYEGETVTLEPPELGYGAARLVDFDAATPQVTDGGAADHPEYDLYYDHEDPEAPSAYFRIHSEQGALLADGPDTHPQGPTECEAALRDAPLRDYLPQSTAMLEAGGGYCLRTTEGDLVWFSVNSLSGEAENYRFAFLATLWPET